MSAPICQRVTTRKGRHRQWVILLFVIVTSVASMVIRARRLQEILSSVTMGTEQGDMESVHTIETRASQEAMPSEQDWQYGDIVHVVNTRFMQFQPDLLELGRARLELFKTFCLPTMVHQSSNNFLWIIRTDPSLHPELLNATARLIASYPNVFLIKQNSYSGNFRNYNVPDPSHIVSGNKLLLDQLHAQANNKTIIESRLDADDGLHRDFIRHLQDLVRMRFATQRKPPSPRWMYFCIDIHVEWHSGVKESMELFPSGYLRGRKDSICVTPGLSLALAPGVPWADAPHVPHGKLAKTVRRCNSLSEERECLMRLTSLLPAGAIRARTPSSAGMHNVGVKLNKPLHPDRWQMLKELFNITERSARDTQEYFHKRMIDIARENLEGQCTIGGSCKKEGKQMLNHIMHMGNETMQT